MQSILYRVLLGIAFVYVVSGSLTIAQDLPSIDSEMQLNELMETLEEASEKLRQTADGSDPSEILGSAEAHELSEAASIASIRLYNNQNPENSIDPEVALSLSTGQVQIGVSAESGAPLLSGRGNVFTPILQPHYDATGNQIIGLSIKDFGSFSPDELRRAIADIKEKCGESTSCVPTPTTGGPPPKVPRPVCPPVCGGSIPCPKGCDS